MQQQLRFCHGGASGRGMAAAPTRPHDSTAAQQTPWNAPLALLKGWVVQWQSNGGTLTPCWQALLGRQTVAVIRCTDGSCNHRKGCCGAHHL